MTFVAQPYERFVDDLLIALTGGTIREEYEFVGIDRAYAVGSPGLIPESLRVFGQRDGAFVLFDGGVDYRYDANEQAVLWETKGRPPDDHTFFYISYFREEGDRRLTDRNPGSVTTTLAEAFARQFAVLHKQMQMVYESAFVDTASGPSLDHIAALLALTRKDAKFASGEVLFKRSTPAPADISIPAGTVVSTDDGQNFETTDRRTLRRDQLSVVSPIRAQAEGAGGRVDAGKIVTVNRPIFGIESVLNERATFFASERETDDELRRRIKGSLERAGRSTMEAIRQSLIEDVPELSESNVALTEQTDVPGFLDLRLGVADGSNPDLVRRVEASIFGSRPAGVRVRHNLSGQAPPAQAEGVQPARSDVVADFKAVGAPEPGVSVGAEGAQAGDAVLALRVEILLRLAERNVAVAEREAIADKVRTAVIDYVSAVPMGRSLVYNKLLGRIVQPDEIADAALLVAPRDPASGGAVYRTNLDSPGRKLAVDPKDVVVELMEQSVRIAIRVQLQPKPPATPPAQAAPPPQVTDALRATLRAAIEPVLAAATGTLQRDQVRAAVTIALGGPNADLLVAERNGVVMNATYEETGRLLNDADAVALADHEVAVLDDLTVEIPGTLDA
jgi:Baseplate J-like protein